MAEFDDKLNSILGNPDAMAQIMQLAQTLSGSEASEASSPQPVQPPPPQAVSPTGNSDVLSMLTGSFDPQLLLKLLPILQELGNQENSPSRQLLYALRPYLKQERQDKVERALQLARLLRLGKNFLSNGGGL